MQTDSIIHRITQHVREFIIQNEEIDTHRILLSKQLFDEISNTELVTQIEGRRKAKRKLPDWYQKMEIIYPVRVSMEQCSSQITAKWKSENYRGGECVDFTGGFGVDSYWFSKSFSKVAYVEKNNDLFETARYNHSLLSATNIEHFCVSAEEYLKNNNGPWSLIYLDPSRRTQNSRVISLDKYQPDILSLLSEMKQKAGKILIKTSPLLDISDALSKLGTNIRSIILVVNNECRELLFEWDEKNKGNEIMVSDPASKNKDFIFELSEEKESKVTKSEIGQYIYEPNAGILKSGGYNSVTIQTGLPKLHENTHLYTSDNLVEFPGRRFKVEKIISPNKAQLKQILPSMKANLTLRNFPDTTEALRKKLGLLPGGEDYVFAVTNNANQLILILCSRISTNKPEPDK